MPPKKERPAEPLLAKMADAVGEFAREERYLIGVSGGRDSVALLHALSALGFENLIVCHLDHGLRGKASSSDVRFVKQLSRTLGVRCVSEKKDVARFAVEKRISLETAAREARYEFFRG